MLSGAVFNKLTGACEEPPWADCAKECLNPFNWGGRKAGKRPRAAKGTPLTLDTATTWGKVETLADHFARHGADFGAKTADEYASMASRFFQESQTAKLPTKIDSQGVIRVFDPTTGSFGAFNPNGTTRTFFKPNSPTYFDRQPGTLVP
ncbi:hypothetical protein AGMMS50225_28710 [Betaproteobacteria bacterium]|nr:hypothetical protein AGMMS50225_28710 [Betaproteobacteria bacterium]